MPKTDDNLIFDWLRDGSSHLMIFFQKDFEDLQCDFKEIVAMTFDN
jgi:hypothetical protein